MMIRATLAAVALAAITQPAFAQEAGNTIDCDNPANAENEICLALPADGVTNFVPLVAPVLGAIGVGVAAAAAGGGSTTSTPSTTNN